MADGLVKGYTRIANEILENIMIGGFSKREHILFSYVFRNGYGWGHEQSAVDLDTNKISRETGLDVSNINETLRLLEGKNIMKREKGQILFNRHIEQWKKVETASKDKRSKQPRNKVETTFLQGQNNPTKTHNRQSVSDLQLPKENINKKESPITPKNEPLESARQSKQDIDEIIAFLNETTGKSFKASTSRTQKDIRARLNEGFTIEDFKAVIKVKSDQWNGDTKMDGYLRPQTLFSNKFEGYLQESNRATKTQTAFGFESADTGIRGYGL